ncbi:MAG: macrocin O-methyltransferase [Nitrospira sp. CG24A]|nr:MAG: macrocin O-methyltransferase [Nitrospira sp. CG24A]
MSQPVAGFNGGVTPEQLYLHLMKQCLTRMLWREKYRPMTSVSGWRRVVLEPLQSLLRQVQLEVVKIEPDRMGEREDGRDWPIEAETMVGLKRLDNLQHCVTSVIRDGVPGDLIETGVWRGGSSIFMRAVLQAYGDCSRKVWLADSFRGLPQPDPARYPVDRGDTLWTYQELAISLDEVKANFSRYGLLDEQVKFLPGWFRDTLPAAPINRLAVLRLDGDLYESTMDALSALYHKVSPGGFIIVDDYGLPTCRAAIEDFRRARGITDQIHQIDWTGAFWQRSTENGGAVVPQGLDALHMAS